MVYEFKLPDIAEGVHEGEIVQWHVKEGDKVVEDQDMVEVMTDKATVMIKSPKNGTIAQLKAQEGEMVKVGDVIITIDTGDGGAAAPPAKQPAAEPATTETVKGEAEEEEKTLFDLPTDFSGGSKLRKKRAPAAGVRAAQKPAAGPAAATGEKLRERTLAAPAIRWKAREMGLDLDTIPASGPNGRITTQDWQSFLSSGGAASAATAGAIAGAAMAAGAGKMAAPSLAVGDTDEVVPLKGLRKAIFENMRRSKDYAAHFTYWDEADVTELVKLRKDAKSLAKAQGVKLTYLAFIVKASVAALKLYPDMNAWVDENERALVRKNEYHVGVATATERGLMVVVVRDADKKSIFEIARDIEALSQKAREGKATREEVTGSTFTITSLGKTGGLGATPVINHPESAILGIHKMEPRAKVDDDRNIVVRECMNVSGSFDHRWIDGHVAAEFVQHIVQLLEKPNLLLLGTT